MRHPFRKKWGQNFLKDPNTITKIINCLDIKNDDIVLEVGPGDGALTDELCRKNIPIHAIEIDPLLIDYLSEKKLPNLYLYHQNILEWDFSILSKNCKIIGNLPYYLSSPILFHFLNIQKWERMVLMFQKEVAERIVSTPNSKSYGRLSVMSQVYTNVNIKFIVKKNIFYPRPEVDSAVVVFSPKKNNLPDMDSFSKFIKLAFSHRRKMLKNNLHNNYKIDPFKKYNNMRPEEISPIEYIKLFQLI